MSITIIGITGGSCSGKSSISKKFNQSFGKNCQIICEDSFYKSLTTIQLETVDDYNFDHPNALNFDEMERVILDIKSGKKKIKVPVYNFITHQSTSSIELDLTNVQIVIFEGIFLYYYSTLDNSYFYY